MEINKEKNISGNWYYMDANQKSLISPIGFYFSTILTIYFLDSQNASNRPTRYNQWCNRL